MSKPRYGWWSYVKDMIFRYPALCESHSLSLAQKVTPTYSAQPGGGGSGRTTEQTTVRAMTRNAAREYEAVHLAIQQTQQLDSGAERLQIIRAAYWKRTHTLSGAALAANVSYRTARRWNGEFIRRVAKNYGLLD